MKRLLQLAVLILCAQYASAQEIHQLGVGPAYSMQTYYNIETGDSHTNELVAWDLSFSTHPMDAGIHYNEGVALGGEALRVYLTNSTDYADVDTNGMQKIVSDEKRWSSGAFNDIANPADPFDMGWGTYDVVTHSTNGSKVFVVETRSQDYLKLMIESLVDGVYTIKYANLDGSNEQTKTIAKSDYQGKTRVFLSLSSNEILDLEPDSWDLLFTRYFSWVEDPGGGPDLDYGVTGVLCNNDMLVAEARGVDVESADYNDFTFSSDIDAIGHDWKMYIAPSWVVHEDIVFWVKTQADILYKLRFYDFEGSPTGISTFETTNLGSFTSSDDIHTADTSFEVYPNPASNQINIAIEYKSELKESQALIYNPLGQLIAEYPLNLTNGLNVQSIDLDFPAGLYTLVLQSESDRIAKPFILK